MQRFHGQINPSADLEERIKDWTPYERRLFHPILQFYADSLEEATAFYVAYYRAMFRLVIDETDFTVFPA